MPIYGRGLFSGKAKQLVEDTITGLEILEGSIAFHKPTKVEFGIFRVLSSVLLGPKVSAGIFGRGSKYYSSGWLFSTSRNFMPEKRMRGGEFPIEPREYRLEIDVPGSGLLEFPGYRLENGIVLLYVIPKYSFRFTEDVLSVGNVKDYAQLSIKPVGNGFEGELTLNLTRAEYATVSLKGKVMEDQIFFGSEPERIRYEFLSEELLIVSHERILDVPKLQKALGLISIVSGHGDFTLRLEVGKSGKEMKFSVFP